MRCLSGRELCRYSSEVSVKITTVRERSIPGKTVYGLKDWRSMRSNFRLRMMSAH